jgi:hypothetical protein
MVAGISALAKPSPAVRLSGSYPAPERDIHFRRLAEADPKGFRVVIFLKIDRDDDRLSVFPVSEPCGLEHVPVEPRPHLDHLAGEICSAQCDRDRAHVRLSLFFGAKTCRES